MRAGSVTSAAGHSDALLLAARELTGPVVDAVTKVDALEGADGTLPALGSAHARVAQG